MNYNIWSHILGGIEGTLTIKGGTSFCEWRENAPNGAKNLKRSLDLKCVCAAADDDNDIVHYKCQYKGEPHKKEHSSYNHNNQEDFYKKLAQKAASMIMT